MSFYFLNIAENEGSGLGNQIYNMAGMLDYAIENNINFLFIGQFLKQIHSQKFCNSGEIFDFNLMNKYFGQKYSVYFFDAHTYTTKINITYHNQTNIINITDYLLNNFLDFDGNIFVSQNTNFKNICYNKNNTLDNNLNDYISIQYFINDIEFNLKYALNNFILEQNIYLCISSEPKTQLFNNSKRNREFQCKNNNVFIDFLANLEFTSFIKDKSTNYFQLLKQTYSIKQTDKINCIHLRLEDDMVITLANEEKCTVEHCKTSLENKYIYFIKEYLDKNDLIIILAHNFNNNVIHFLKENGYKYILTNNLDENREICAAIDLSLGNISCNNIFIPYFQSTFSYVLLHKLKYKITKIPFVSSCINDTTNEFYYGGIYLI
jgi:hypothetical protein